MASTTAGVARSPRAIPSMKALSTSRQPNDSATRRATSLPPEPKSRVMVIAGMSGLRNGAKVQELGRLEAKRFPGVTPHIVGQGTLQSHARQATTAAPSIRRVEQRPQHTPAPLGRNDEGRGH